MRENRDQKNVRIWTLFTQWTLPVPDSFNHYFTLLYTTSFLNLKLLTHTDRLSTKYWPKPKNFIIVDPEMLTMKNEMFHFAPLPHFTLGYPNSLCQLIFHFCSILSRCFCFFANCLGINFLIFSTPSISES